MNAPPDIQVSSILLFLGTALRADPEIQKWTEAAPEEIVAQTVEYKPIERGQGGKYAVYVSQLPALCLSIDSEQRKVVPGTTPPMGREFSASLWYLFQPFQSGSADMHGFTKGQRLSTLMWWRIAYWLRKQKSFSLTAGADGPTFDLQTVGKIRLLELDGADERIALEDIEGLRIPIKVWHGYAPYEEIDPVIMELVSIGITSEEGSGVGVSADVDTSAA